MADHDLVKYIYFDLDTETVYSSMQELLKEVRRANWAVPQLAGYLVSCMDAPHHMIVVVYSLKPINVQEAIRQFWVATGRLSYGGAPCQTK